MSITPSAKRNSYRVARLVGSLPRVAVFARNPGLGNRNSYRVARGAYHPQWATCITVMGISTARLYFGLHPHHIPHKRDTRHRADGPRPSAADGTAPSAHCVPPCPNRPWRLVTVVTGSRAVCYVSPYHKARDHVSSVTNRRCDRLRRRALWRRVRRGYRW